MQESKKNIGILLLAAGQAARMGMPKQLLVYRHQPLIRHMIRELLVLKLPITVVLGARAQMIRPVIQDYPVDIIENPDWELGMGVSLRVGLRHLQQATNQSLKGVLCCVVDQPYLNHKLLQKYLEVFVQLPHPKEALLAANYQNGIIGVPALLGANYISSLQNSEKTIGARRLLKEHQEKVITIDFPEGAFDLDQQEDWEKFRKK